MQAKIVAAALTVAASTAGLVTFIVLSVVGSATATDAPGLSGVPAPTETATVTATATATATVTPTPTNTPLPDLTITKSDEPNKVKSGAELTYTVVVENIGGSSAGIVQMFDYLPVEFTFTDVDVVPSSGFCVHTGASPGGTVQCDLGTMAPSDTATITITGTASGSDSTISNTAEVDPGDAIAEASEANNDDTELTTLNSETAVPTTTATPTITITPTGTPLPDLQITKSDDPDKVASGGTITYTLLVENDSLGGTGDDVHVHDNLPDGFDFDSATTSDGTCDYAPVPSVEVQCDLGPLGPGESSTITVTGSFSSTSDTTIQNVAEVDPHDDISEADETNNQDSENTSVNGATPTSTATATPTATAGTPGPGTSTPTGTPTDPSGGTATPTSTTSPTQSATPTRTPTRTPSPTPTEVSSLGDVSCNGLVNSIDGLLMLQFIAGLIFELPCPENADANQDGRLDSRDVALVLQVDAGLLSTLPPLFAGSGLTGW